MVVSLTLGFMLCAFIRHIYVYMCVYMCGGCSLSLSINILGERERERKRKRERYIDKQFYIYMYIYFPFLNILMYIYS